MRENWPVVLIVIGLGGFLVAEIVGYVVWGVL
jgi:hypothetical protein